eukprot:2857288-Rhodomonas_salina.1
MAADASELTDVLGGDWKKMSLDTQREVVRASAFPRVECEGLVLVLRMTTGMLQTMMTVAVVVVVTVDDFGDDKRGDGRRFRRR